MSIIFYQNVNRIRTKTSEFYLNLLNTNYDALCLTETNLNIGVFDGELFDTRYNVFRRDRSETSIISHKKDGGGVLIATRKDWNVIRQATWESKYEDIWVSILPSNPNMPTLHICLVYLRPDMPTHDMSSFYAHYQSIVLKAKETDEFLLVGDFNTPNITWSHSLNSSELSPNNPSDIKATLLIDNAKICNLSQFNNISNENNRYLDLVFSTVNMIKVYGADPMSRMDKHHPALAIEMPNICKPTALKPNQGKKRYNFYKSNFDKIKEELCNLDWLCILSSDDVNICLDLFYRHLYDIIKKHTPLIRDDSHKYPIWYSYGLKRCLKEKNKFHRRYKKFGNPRDYDVFSLLRSRCKSLTESCYKEFVFSVEDSLEGDIRSFWRFVHNKKGFSSIPQTMTYGSQTASDGLGVCELFSAYFSSVFESQTNFPHGTLPSPVQSQNILSGIEISPGEIEFKIKQLDSNKGAGPDEIPPLFVKACGKELCYPLSIIFNKSLKSGIFPHSWKLAHIIPIHKSGDKSNCENYRPISILSCMAKLFESLVYKYLFNHLQPLISDKQHGFVKGKSTISNLLEYKNYLCQSFAVRGQVDSIYTDFSKAFDKVSHSLLVHKVMEYGIHGSLHRWITSYLGQRSQLVAVKGYTSKPLFVSSGVPQGSHLGPLLFILFINDLAECLENPCLLYADDLKVFRKVNDVNDCLSIQNDINKIANWCSNNMMSLNVKKCFVVSFTNKKTKLMYSYQLSGHLLQRQSVVRDLGIYFDEQLTFRYHYENITGKANKLLGFIIRASKHFKKYRSSIYLFQSLVRPILEYGSVIWSPYYVVHIDNIERIQRKFTRFLSYKCKAGRSRSSYEERLEKFNMVSLKYRRNQSDLLYLYKIIHNGIDSSYLLSLLSFNTNNRTRAFKPFALRSYINNTSFYNPIVRMCRLYNSIVSIDSNIDIYVANYVKFKGSLADALRSID
ncbi:hypothetical protein JYU34_005343 [Plutella xylostella]|uniref:Reverse transcriptase domain-containing protein n=1 Tax=Plutella xylostella TaxID=51655 RepID=A0ABQ7QWH4_PLUXY|nr:hypothetical protein JYU34_005343 [Plutella xylostella]